MHQHWHICAALINRVNLLNRKREKVLVVIRTAETGCAIVSDLSKVPSRRGTLVRKHFRRFRKDEVGQVEVDYRTITFEKRHQRTLVLFDVLRVYANELA